MYKIKGKHAQCDNISNCSISSFERQIDGTVICTGKRKMKRKRRKEKKKKIELNSFPDIYDNIYS